MGQYPSKYYERHRSRISHSHVSTTTSSSARRVSAVKRNCRAEEGPVDVLRSKCGARAGVYACQHGKADRSEQRVDKNYLMRTHSATLILRERILGSFPDCQSGFILTRPAERFTGTGTFEPGHSGNRPKNRPKPSKTL